MDNLFELLTDSSDSAAKTNSPKASNTQETANKNYTLFDPDFRQIDRMQKILGEHDKVEPLPQFMQKLLS